MTLAREAVQRCAAAALAGVAVSILDTEVATVIVIARAGAAEGDGGLVGEDEADRLTGTSQRMRSEARRRGELAAYGRQRTRTYKRGELLAWAEGRRAPVHEAPAGNGAIAIEQRMARIEAERAEREAQRTAA